MSESKEKTPEEAAKLVEDMRQWLKTQDHLPQDLGDNFLLQFIHSCYYDLDKARTAMELFFTLRASAPELVNNRDPLSPNIQKSLRIVNLAQIEMETKNLWIWQLNDPGLENFDYVQDAKLFFLSTDAWLLDNTKKVKNRLQEADYVLMDVKDVSLKMLTKFNLSVARKLSKYQQEAMPIRLRQIHLVNAPPFIDKLFGFMKPMLKQEITDMVHFHPPKSETLFEYISKDFLPSDYGGNLPPMQEHMKDILKVITDNRDHFLNDDLWKAIDKKSKNKTSESTEVGSFRSLAID